MTTVAAARLARCTYRGCPWRWRAGPDRACPEHAFAGGQDEELARFMAMAGSPPDGRDSTPPGDADSPAVQKALAQLRRRREASPGAEQQADR
jgi:hypothetical protein